MSDLISRTACLQKISKMMDTEGFRDGWAVSRTNVKLILELMPSVNTEIIRCKDCKYYCNVLYSGTQFEHGKCCRTFVEDVKADDFCSRAERKTDEGFDKPSGCD